MASLDITALTNDQLLNRMVHAAIRFGQTQMSYDVLDMNREMIELRSQVLDLFYEALRRLEGKDDQGRATGKV